MNLDLLYHMHTHVIPAGLSLLPAQMTSPAARAMLLAIGLQESKFRHRVQVIQGGKPGPAHGFWQFEKGGGIKGVLTHDATAPIILPIVKLFCYKDDTLTCWNAVTHNDVLAAIFARLLLWTVRGRLPRSDEHLRGWHQYLDGWRPGIPHPESWATYYAEAWKTVTIE